MEFVSQNTNTLMHEMYLAIMDHGVPEESRNGKVLRFPGHTTVTITNPRQRVNFSPARDANPFFHLIESVAMLCAFNSVELLSYFAKNMVNFSDDGQTFNAFYGTRARGRSLDQLFWAAHNLKKNPNSRQEVVVLCDHEDLARNTKDKACNLCMIFTVNQKTGAVDMSTFNRSNDMVWGFVTGANIVHFSYFQEFIACALGLPVGVWHHTSSNMHLYLNNQAQDIVDSLEQEKLHGMDTYYDNFPSFEESNPRLFCGGLIDADDFTTDCHALCTDMLGAIKHDRVLQHRVLRNCWISDTVVPVFNAFQARKLGQDPTSYLGDIASPDWREACTMWVNRRNK